MMSMKVLLIVPTASGFHMIRNHILVAFFGYALFIFLSYFLTLSLRNSMLAVISFLITIIRFV